LTYTQLRTSGQCFVVANASGTFPMNPLGGLQAMAPSDHGAESGSDLFAQQEAAATSRHGEMSVPRMSDVVWSGLAQSESGWNRGDEVGDELARTVRNAARAEDSLFANFDYLGELLDSAVAS
jgi:hypothetical protein